MSAYYATGGPAQGPAGPSTLTPVLVSFSGPAPQSRATVAVRFLMVIPHTIILLTMAVAAGVVAFIGWFGALFTGRLPVFAADFLTGYVRWVSRVQAYTWLLTDEYPPFTLGDPDYPVRVAIAPGQQLNRAAVFFRFFLLIPCGIVQSVVTYGALTVFQLANWLIVLVKGQMPDTIHQGMSAVLRYNFRVISFALMLTSEYPAGLFGDPEVAGAYGQAQPGYGYGAGAVDRRWLLFLSAPARKLVIFFIVFGVIVSVGVDVYRATTLGNDIGALAATAQVSADNASMHAAIAGYQSDLKACPEELACLTRVDRMMADTLNRYASQLRTISMPPQATAASARLITAASSTAAIFARLGSATSVDQYNSIAQLSGAQQAGEQVDTAYDNLVSALTS